MNPVHDRGSLDPVHMKVIHVDPVQSGDPWTTFIWTGSKDPLSWTGFMDSFFFFFNNEK